MMTNHLTRAALAGVLIGCAFIGLMFGRDIARCRAMAEALADMEECHDLTDVGAEQTCVDAAYARLMDAKGGK